MSESQPGVAHKQAERQRVSRDKCDVGIEIEWGAAKLPGRVREISAEAFFVELDQPLWVGAKFAAQLDSAQRVRLECEVKRAEPGRGMAVSFSSADLGSAAIVSLMENPPKK